ncbi:hypothetical protein Ahy_B01g055429 isoform A [Arachis hypogaea]|uniref:Malic enzyme NAD-binding domain-containing protein n=1 Tax=Arachis hypogaea TaxID=3818 RepID=A0A445AW64_ARAHY|nr:hypothetical protein Ahy_B01g055429 isoform A [Arachis hypogaea]
MAVFTFEDEITSPLPPSKLYNAMKDADSLTPKIIDDVKSVEIVEGNGGPGTIKKLTIVEDGETKFILHKVKKVRPHVLLGLSGVGGNFNEEVLKAMKESVSTKPAIFAMSSPTMNAECTAIDAFKHAGGDIVFGSGSPFENIDLSNEKVGHVNHANNIIGLGSLLSAECIAIDAFKHAGGDIVFRSGSPFENVDLAS